MVLDYHRHVAATLAIFQQKLFNRVDESAGAERRSGNLRLPANLWMVLLATFVCVLALAAHFHVTLENYQRSFGTCAFLLLLAACLNRMRFALLSRSGLLLEAAAFVLLGSALGRYLAYELQMFAMPLQDGFLAEWDRALGFDYTAVLKFVDGSEWSSKILHRAYYSFQYQIVGTLVVLAGLGLVRKINVLLCSLLMGLLACCIVSAIFPAAGAITVLPQDMSLHNLSLDGATPVAHLRALRDGTFQALALPSLGGIITFPSYHVVMAVVLAYVWRDSKLGFFPVAGLNSLMAVSAVTQGGHYLVDCLAGLAVALAAIVLSNQLLADRRGAGQALVLDAELVNKAPALNPG